MSLSPASGLRAALSLVLLALVPSAADGQLAPTGLVCTVVGQTVEITWSNPEPFDFIEIRRNGSLIQTIPGSVTSFLDPGVPATFHFYNVHGVVGTVVGPGAPCSVQVIPPPDEPPLEPPPSLKTLLPPIPSELFNYVKDFEAAVRLGKTFFWDMQAGSDGVTACATCHYHAGTDTRTKNILNPGPNGVFETGEPNRRLRAAHYPFHRTTDPLDANSPVLTTSDDGSGSQGVHLGQFNDVIPGSDVDDTTDFIDPSFTVDALNVRQTTSRNAPTIINAVYNIENFWDGRASFWFNGRNPFGQRDTGATVLQVQPDGTVAQTPVLIERASLASQAVGPPSGGVEMSVHGRDFLKLGKKLLSLEPLAGQEVSPTDSVLGALVDVDGLGLNTTYEAMIQAAFQNIWWESDRLFDSAYLEIGQGTPANTDQFTLMEANFSFIWGLAILAYESTLVSDDSPFDQYMDGDAGAMTGLELQGLDVFSRSTCLLCHTSPVFTSAVATKLTVVLEPEASALEGILERMPMKDALLSIYDGGFYNIGATPTTSDIGRGGVDPFGNPLSFAGMVRDFGLESLPFQPGTVILNPPVLPSEDVAMAGAMKTPTLRNTELTGPYFHHGGSSTLEQVVEFYARGGDFAAQNADTLAPEILPLPFLSTSPERRAAMVAFMEALTDERVRQEAAPFDHPQLFIPNGAAGDHNTVIPAFAGALTAADDWKMIPAVGQEGRAAAGLPPLLEFLQPHAVEDMTCENLPGVGILLSWTNADSYPLIRIERDGFPLIVVPGVNAAHTDPNLTPGRWEYDIHAIEGTQIGLRTVCVVDIPPPAPSTVSASQLGAGVIVNWTNTYSYDGIQVLRNGELIATVTAGSTVYFDTVAIPGEHTYEVIGLVESVPSVPVAATTSVIPAPVFSVSCTEAPGGAGVDITWGNSEEYDSVEVLREGVLLASVPGGSTQYTDASPLSGITEYQVIARTNGIDSLAEGCVMTIAPAPLSSLTCADGGGTTQLTWTNGDTYSAIELRRGGLPIADLPGAATSATDPELAALGPGIHIYELVPSTDGVTALSSICQLDVAPTGVSGLTCGVIGLGNLVSWTNTGAYPTIEVRRDGALIATLAGSSSFLLDELVVNGTFTYEVTTLADGLTSAPVACTLSRTPAPVTQLTCSDTGAGIQLSWSNAELYDSVEIFRNGQVIAALPGVDATFLDATPPAGLVSYAVRAISNGEISAAAPSCLVNVLPSPVTGLGCVSTGPCGGEILLDWSNAGAYDEIRIDLNGLTVATLPGGSTTYTATVPGAGNHSLEVVALSGGIPAAPTACAVTVLDDTASAPTGLVAQVVSPVSCTVELSWALGGTYSALEVRQNGALLQALPGTATTATVNATGSSEQLLELVATTECGTELPAVTVTIICDSEFLRGDANADGGRDISDAIFLLFALFVNGAPPVCEDAADANDDGVIDIADATASLAAVFGQVTSLPAPFSSCGPDNTSDTLQCTEFSTCP